MTTIVKYKTIALNKEDIKMLEELMDKTGENPSAILRKALYTYYTQRIGLKNK